jgi:hypothetical protein
VSDVECSTGIGFLLADPIVENNVCNHYVGFP